MIIIVVVSILTLFLLIGIRRIGDPALARWANAATIIGLLLAVSVVLRDEIRSKIPDPTKTPVQSTDVVTITERSQSPTIPSVTLTAVSTSTDLPTATSTLEPTTTPSPIPPTPPLPTLPPGYMELTSHGNCQSFDVCGSLSPVHKYSHFPPIGKIRYTVVGVDDDLQKVELVCISSAKDITYLFVKIGEVAPFPRYQSADAIEVEPGCRLDFTLTNTILDSGMSLSFRVDP